VLAGSTLGPYVIVRPLDAGGMGEVYEARDVRLDRRVALKVVRGDLATDPGRRRRLEREARAAATLNHPFIVTLHSLEEHGGVLFLTMELVEGTTLRDAIPTEGLACDQLLHIAIQLTEAVAAAHDAGIIHRDLKPANIMITPSGGLKVLDFGLSKHAVDGTATARITESLATHGSLLGTAPYMAPEVIEGREADARSDIFSLGIVLFEMATGRRPFEGETPLAAITSILRDEPPLASRVRPAVPIEFAELVDRCLAKDPARRRQSAADLRNDLESLASRPRAEEKARAAESGRRSPESSLPMSRAAARRAMLAGLGVAVAVVTLVAVLARGSLETSARDTPDVADLQGEPAAAAASEVDVQRPREQARVAKRDRSVDPTAYGLYLRAVTLLDRVNRTDTQSAISALEEAVSLDPVFADAYGALASAYWWLYTSYLPEEAGRLEPRARAAVAKALSLDPESAHAVAVQGDLLWDTAHGWRHEEAIQAHKKALVLDPSLKQSHRRLATIYNHVGLADLVLRELAQVDESPAVLFQKGMAFRVQGRDDLALASWLAIPTSSRNASHLGHLAWILSDVGRPEDAWHLLRGIPAGAVDVNGMLSAAEALLHAVAGERRQAESRIAAATQHASATSESHHATYLVASAYARLGKSEESLRWLRFTAANGFPCYPLMARDRNLASLRAYPPFVVFLNELKSRWDGYRARLGVPATE
jgi:tetratricopeptide (TPR) repeat protein